MEERAWKVTLADGTSLGSLKLNGNNFISTTEVTKEMFEDNLTEVTIEGGDTIEKHENMELVQISKMGEEWWFILRDIPAEELEQMALKAQLDYLSMMVDPRVVRRSSKWQITARSSTMCVPTTSITCGRSGRS